MTAVLDRNPYRLHFRHAFVFVECVNSTQVGRVVTEQHFSIGVLDPNAVEPALERNAAGVVDFALRGMQDDRGYGLGSLDAHLADVRLPLLKRRLSAQG